MNNEELITLAKNGDREAYQELFRQNENLVYKFARRWQKRGLPIEFNDLVSLTWMGMYNAYLTFDPSRGLFSTWAGACAKGEINHHLQYIGRKGRKGITVPLEKVIGKQDQKKKAVEWIGYHDRQFTDTENRIVISEFAAFCKGLNTRKQAVFQGLLNDMTGEEIAQQIHTTKSYVYQIKKQLFDDLQKYVKRWRVG